MAEMAPQGMAPEQHDQHMMMVQQGLQAILASQDINEVHAIRTDFDFKEANKAVQKALNQLSAAAGEDKTQASFNEWGDSSATQSN